MHLKQFKVCALFCKFCHFNKVVATEIIFFHKGYYNLWNEYAWYDFSVKMVFYLTRVRSMITLVTYWQTDSLLFRGLDWCDPCVRRNFSKLFVLLKLMPRNVLTKVWCSISHPILCSFNDLNEPTTAPSPAIYPLIDKPAMQESPQANRKLGQVWSRPAPGQRWGCCN